MAERRLPPHITEDDVRLIAEMITPTIVGEARRATLREVAAMIDMNPLVSAEVVVNGMLADMGGDMAEQESGPKCQHCYRDLKFSRSSQIWFHADTKRVDCLMSAFDDSPYTTAWPPAEWEEAVAEETRP